MQSMFRLPWSTESPGDRIMEKSTLHKARPLPAVEIPSLLNKIKRQRTDSPEPVALQHTPAVKKWKGANGEVQPIKVASGPADGSVVDGLPVDSQSPAEAQGPILNLATTKVLNARAKVQPLRREDANKSRLPDLITTPASLPAESRSTSTMDGHSPLQQSIEAQINYEILLKHNELRLIEQELAKCQVSLEQLRRCSVIPFPGTDGFSESVSGGVGSALQTPAGYTDPQYAAPWGVTDGPYTRHYAKWLISDAKFDSISERALAQQSHGYFGAGEGRATRGGFAEFSATGRARTSRTSTGTLKLQALGEIPAPAPKVDPLLHKRSTDGQWVRLYCAQCGHSNFSNTQGFLNHCRIKHSQVFKSHDQAAVACGVPVDVNDAGNPVTATDPISTPISTPAVAFPACSTSGTVHPLIHGKPSTLAPDVHRDPSKTTDLDSPMSSASSCTISSATPHLTALLQKRGFQGDLKALVDSARTKLDVDMMDISDDDHAGSAVQTPVIAGPKQPARLPLGTQHVSSARPSSKKGPSNGHARMPLKLPAAYHGVRIPESPTGLSPNAVDSNPGLVSDHDDDDDEDGDDAHSQPELIMNDNFVIEDASDVEDVHERRAPHKELDECCAKDDGSLKH